MKILFIYLLILLDTGGAYKRTTYFLAIVSILFLYQKYRNEELRIEKTQNWYIDLIILISGIFAALVGIDTYESIYGVVRLIAYGLVSFALRQINEEEKIAFIKEIPIMGIIMIAFSGFKCIPYFDDWISSTGRLAGSFEYPNTMALFLLIGIVITENEFKREKWIFQIILILGIFATGSRTAFVLTLGYLIFSFIKHEGGNKFTLLIFGFLILVIWIFSISGKSMNFFERFLTFDMNASTLQGRLLYWEDACRMISKYPMGLGYMGYYYLQQVMQTGMYRVRFVHNELLQFMLDYGVFAGIGAGIGIGRKIRREKRTRWQVELFALILIYSLFDFHLQYWSIILVFLLTIPQGKITVVKKSEKERGVPVFMGIVSLLVLLICNVTAERYADRDNYEAADRWNPLSTEYKTEILLKASNLEVASAYTKDILENNQYIYPVYIINSNKAAEDGDLDSFIKNRRKVLQIRKYEIKEYEDYFKILLMWYDKGYRQKDKETMDKCINAMSEILEFLEEVKKNTSVRAMKIKEKPKLYFDMEYKEIFYELQRRNQNE